MRSLYDIRRELVKHKQNLKEINRLIAASDRRTDLFKEKLKIKCKIKKVRRRIRKEKLW